MAKKAKKMHTKTGVELKIVNPNAAGIDIADTEMQVCVPVDRAVDNNRRFGSFTRDLNEIYGWLKDCGIDTAAMEATGIYWIPLFFKLKESGIDVILVNAHEVKNISEKKTDEADAEWLMYASYLRSSQGKLPAGKRGSPGAQSCKTPWEHPQGGRQGGPAHAEGNGANEHQALKRAERYRW